VPDRADVDDALAERRQQWEVVAEALGQVWRDLTPMEPGFAR
jgi:hypothetical protein